MKKYIVTIYNIIYIRTAKNDFIFNSRYGPEIYGPLPWSVRIGSNIILEQCKIVLQNWTFFWFTAHLVAYEQLLVMVKTIFDKTQVSTKKSIFYVKTYQKVALNHFKLVRGRSKIFFGDEYLALKFGWGGNWGMVVIVGW